MARHSLSPLSDKIPSYDIYSFDIETTGNSNDFLMGSIVSKWNKVVFWNKEDMIKCLMTNVCFGRNARIFATNLSFDITALFQGSPEMEWLEFLFRGTRIIQAQIPSKGRTLVFLDTMNYYPFSVRQMGKIVGLPKLDTPAYIIERRMPREDEREYIEQYNVRDSEITYRFASFLQDSFSKMGCKMRMTAASTAMDLFKRKYLPKPMYQEHKERIKLQYQAYYGGRVEVFKRGLIRDANYYDFNSLYPSVMRNEYPDVSSSKYREKGDLGIIDAYEGISEVEVLCPEDLHIPFLPYREDTKLLFPTGCFKGWYSHAELRKALELGYRIYGVGRQIYYTHTHHPFRKYVENLYAIRKAKKEAFDPTELIIKLLMNSLYGKFGQKIQGQQECHNISNMSKEEIDEFSKLGKVMITGNYLYFEKEDPSYISSHIMPIYALYTTAYGRIKLYDAMKDIDPIYIDTDSIITHEKLATSGELGDLKLEYAIDEGIIIRPKMYALKTKDGKSIVRIKGNNASFSWDYVRFKEFIAKPVSRKDIFSTFKMSNRKQIPYNTIIPMEKEYSLEDDKRDWESLFNPLLMMESKPIRI